MKYNKILSEDSVGRIWYRSNDNPHFREVFSVTKAAKILKRTRRQVYRYIKAGILKTAGKMLGEWLITQDSANLVQANPLMVQPLPSRFKRFFPEFRIQDINPGKDRITVISRLLEQGDLNDIRWLIKRYGSEELKKVVIHEGNRLLSPRALRQWLLFFGIFKKPNKNKNRFKNPWDSREDRK